jgi:hypothetical protein
VLAAARALRKLHSRVESAVDMPVVDWMDGQSEVLQRLRAQQLKRPPLPPS